MDMVNFDPNADFDLTWALADAADAVSTSHFRSADFRRTYKGDGTPVSQIDFDTEQAMVEIVRKVAPGDHIIGEEVGEIPGSDVGQTSDRRWIFDGIDGTHNFAEGRTGWATIISLEVSGVVMIGMISAPREGRRFWAIRSGGAWEVTDSSGHFTRDAPTRLEANPTPADLVESRVIVTPPEGFLVGWRNQPGRRFTPPSTPRSRCFALDSVMVATGEVDAAVLLFGSLWDFAAPSLIVEEAGGHFRDAWGESRLTTNSGVFTAPPLTEPLQQLLASVRPKTPDRPRLSKTMSTPLIHAGETELIGAADGWTQFGLRQGPSMSARHHVDNAPPFILDIVDERAAELARPIVGVTSNGVPIPGLRTLENGRVDTRAVQEAVLAFVQALQPEQRAQATFRMDAVEWRTWINVHMNHFRHGVLVEDLSTEARERALDILRATLSARGFATARTIMRVNELVALLTGDFNAFGEWPYFVSIFGSPGNDEPWGFQFDGHHLVVNAAVIDGHIVTTPMFLGAEPRAINHGPLAGTNLFDIEESHGLSLLRSLDATQRSQAVIHPSIHPDDLHPNLQNVFDGRMQAGAFHDNLVAPYQGICSTALSDAQRALVRSLLQTYAQWNPEDRAAVKMTEVDAHIDETWFSWYGGHGDDSPFYYRVHSPVILVEFDHHPGVVFDNDVPTRHHVHTVVRTPNGGDYGIDLLRLHHERFDHSGGAHTPRPGR